MKRQSRMFVALMGVLLFSMVGTQVFAQDVTINIALANNPISQALERIARENYSAPGVTLNIAVLPENDLRQKLTTEASTGGTTYDMFYIGPYEAANWARFGWLENLEPYFDALPADKLEWYDRDDLIDGMVGSLSLDGEAYALPFYGEASFTMYNEELFEANGLTMPEEPTWEEIYELAKQIHDPENGIVGMTMRGAPGWGMSGAPFVTMVNAFGGRFYDMEWNATIDTPEQRAAWKMYKKILREAGQPDILSYTYNECIALMQSGNCGIYYDATSIAPPLEAEGSAVRGKVGYAMPPHQKMKTNTSWLWNWAMGINPKSSEEKKNAVFDFMLWATSKDYIKMTVELDPTGASTPPASRASTYELPVYAATPYADATLKTLESTDFTNPTLKPVPYVGLQYIAIPEFADAGTKMTEYLADYVVDEITLDEAISQTQRVFEQVAEDGGYKD
ncbi:extracellular solute-binding protein [candidate division KSB3 bacterium]|uniref:Extracellular solute-binding protein n=1 Tax=candidate division KSB3 bacterium TaxID=2044937 RepID=A0A9D5JY87_9BACT|nr:extracellular solute-binding protein [candidate division KSB3 bacterium]MBD3326514.1 extracellular solute-binding protein [candidate division KSB3 bacterium]